MADCSEWSPGTATEFRGVNAPLLMIEVVAQTWPSTVCRGCCWHLFPAKITTRRTLRRLKVPAMTLKTGEDTIDASSTTTRSYLFRAKFASCRWLTSTGTLKAPWMVSVVTFWTKTLLYPWANRATGTVTSTSYPSWMAWKIEQISTWDFRVPGFPKRTRYRNQSESTSPASRREQSCRGTCDRIGGTVRHPALRRADVGTVDKVAPSWR